jgi:serine/threonine protein kinase
MTKERWKQIEHLFLEAVELDPHSRIRFLDEHCNGDPDLRRSVEEMLASDGDGQDLDQAVSRASRMSDAAWNQGLRIGAYEIVREIGRGGMGTVYQAIRKDGGFEQAVAIKLMRGGLDTGDFARRFRNERRILARLDHPNIARLLDGGTSPDGDPYIVMELVEGEAISVYCEKNHVSLEQRLTLFLSVCDAVRYAHQSLVVHRDLKPSNILVTNDGIVKLLDFGISKLLDPDSEDGTNPRTKTEFRMLTPEYASPEHIRGEDVTTLADV